MNQKKMDNLFQSNSKVLSKIYHVHGQSFKGCVEKNA